MRPLTIVLLLSSVSCSSAVATAPPAEPPTGASGPAEAAAEPSTATEGAPTGAALGNSLDARTLETLVACWFESPYEPMFDFPRPVTIGSRSFGMLMAGIGGILYYGDLNTCAGRVSGTAPRSYSDDRPFEALAGLPVHSDRMHEGQPFGFMNPAIVEWGRRNLIPDPATQVAGVPLQVVYDRVFSRFFRMMTEAYLHLRNGGTYQQEMDAYWQMANGSGEDGIDWLEGRYAGALPAYAAGADGTTMTPPMAIGFWLRRGIDGTSDALWRALREAMQRFDGQWYASLASTYPAQDIEW